MGNRQQATSNRRASNRQQATGNRQQATGGQATSNKGKRAKGHTGNKRQAAGRQATSSTQMTQIKKIFADNLWSSFKICIIWALKKL
jgi:hypothetical protein